jgi:glycosyltransferase involved in cell wall biosynthesis
MARYEAVTWPTFDLRISVSLRDKAVIDKVCGEAPTILIENGTAFAPVPAATDGAGAKLLFMGTLDYYPNVDAAFFLVKEILPIVWAVEPSVRLCIAGRNPPPELASLASDARIEVIGDPEDMAAVAAFCLLSIVPLRIGGGTRIKILDSMAMGLPVVSTSLGCEGLGVSSGVHLAVADNAADLARAILRVVGEEGIRRTFRSNGLLFIERNFQWRTSCEKLEMALEQLVAHRV